MTSLKNIIRYINIFNQFEVSGINNFFSTKRGILLVGLIIGIIAILLQKLGNPANMGICVACFWRDITGSLGLHRAKVVQYIRPEVLGFVLGSFGIAIFTKEFRARGGSSTIIRFFLGLFAMIGALAFLGCPWRALLRLSAGDLNAFIGIGGLVVGIGIGIYFLRQGYNLGRSYTFKKANGIVFPVFAIFLFILLVTKLSSPGGGVFFSSKGPGASHVNLWIGLGAGLLIGVLAQRTRFCTVGALRDIILARDFHLITGVLGLIITALLMNVIFGTFNPGIENQPIAHSNHLANFLGMILAGLSFTLAGGCPGRQLILAGEGDSDAGVFILGMITGAALAHNFSLAAGPDKLKDGLFQMGGINNFGYGAIALGLIFCIIIGFNMREKIR